jgi:hypothetical protein
MIRPALEVADIFRDHGAAWRRANAGHVSLGQLKVMSAIERCRTAALGGHVARCEECSHTHIAYNSCRNRHCPKCQGAAAQEWLADRAADYEVYARRSHDSNLLIPAIAAHQAKLGRVPRLVATDAGFYSARNEAAAKAMGVKRVCIPNRSSRSPDRKREQRKRWFRDGQKWRTGCEGRISVIKRRNGLDRCLYKGDDGMQRWVGFGVISDNLVNIGRVISQRPAR